MAGNCAICGAGLADGAKFCMSCGTPGSGGPAPRAAAGGAPGPDTDPYAPPPPAAQKSNTLLIVILVVAGVVVCGIPFIAIVAAIAIPNLLAAKLSANETAAIATLRNLTSCQAQMQVSGHIDGDGDGEGEYGTFLELTGSVGVRTGGATPPGAQGPPGSSFYSPGKVLSPPILSPALALVDSNGVVIKSGYCYVIYLPDTLGGWCREKGPAAAPGLLGGAQRVGIDASEKRWCAYAWPVAMGNSGNRCFFVNEEGDVFASPNAAARHSGPASLPSSRDALPIGSPKPVAGVVAADGDTWLIVN